MNELRVLRLLRELRCDPIAQWFESVFLGENVEPGSLPTLKMMPSQGTIPDEDEVAPTV